MIGTTSFHTTGQATVSSGFQSLAEEGDGGDDSDDGQTSLDDVGGNGGDSDE